MSSERARTLDPDQFPNYLDRVVGLNQRPRYLVQNLRASAHDFGMSPMQLELLLKVARSFQLLAFEQEFSNTTISKVPRTYLSGEDIPSLAGLIFFGYNQMLVAEKPQDHMSLEQLYPEAVKVIPAVHRQVESYPEILKSYPSIKDRILLPTFPYNPQTKIVRSRLPFTTINFLPSAGSEIKPAEPEYLFNDSESVEKIKQRVEREHTPGQVFGHKGPLDKGLIEIDWSRIDLDKPPGSA